MAAGGGLAGFVTGLSSGLEAYQNQMDRARKAQVAQLELQQKAAELKYYQQQQQVGQLQDRIGMYADHLENNPPQQPASPYSVSGQPPQPQGQPPQQGAAPGGLPGSQPMPQQAPQGGGMPPQQMQRPPQQMQQGMQQPQQPQQQGPGGLPPPPTMQSAFQQALAQAQQNVPGFNMNMPGAQRGVTNVANQIYKRDMDTWKAQREFVQTQFSEQEKQSNDAFRREEHQDSMAERYASLAQTRALANMREGSKGWSIAEVGGKPVRINADTGEVKPLDIQGGALTKMGSGTPRSASAMAVQKYMQENPNATASDIQKFAAGASAAGVKADESSLTSLVKQTDAITAFSTTAKKNFDDALRLAPKAGLASASPWINKWVQTGDIQTGDSNVPAYVVKLLTGANEYAKVMSGGTGNAAPTESVRAETAVMFNQGYSLPAITSAVNAAKSDMDNRLGSNNDQISTIRSRMSGGGSGSGGQGGQPAASGGSPKVLMYDAQGNLKSQ